MLNLKIVVCAILALGHVTLVLCRENKLTAACTDGNFTASVDVTPQHTLDDDALGPATDVLEGTVKLQGVCEFIEAGMHGVQVQVTLPIFNPDAEAPGEPGTTIPDSDEHENVQLYFANEDEECIIESNNATLKPCYRILEVRFNRFKQYRLRLRSKPHNVLKDTGLPDPELDIIEVGTTTWTATFTFDPALLPRNFTRIGVFVVDPSQSAGYARYVSTYRIYNHALSLIDLQVPTNYQVLTDADLINIVLPEENNEYSSYWNGL